MVIISKRINFQRKKTSISPLNIQWIASTHQSTDDIQKLFSNQVSIFHMLILLCVYEPACSFSLNREKAWGWSDREGGRERGGRKKWRTKHDFHRYVFDYEFRIHWSIENHFYSFICLVLRSCCEWMIFIIFPEKGQKKRVDHTSKQNFTYFPSSNQHELHKVNFIFVVCGKISIVDLVSSSCSLLMLQVFINRIDSRIFSEFVFLWKIKQNFV